MQNHKVGAYLRLSKEEFSNEKESNSITNQKLIIDNYLKEHKEYTDIKVIKDINSKDRVVKCRFQKK